MTLTFVDRPIVRGTGLSDDPALVRWRISAWSEASPGGAPAWTHWIAGVVAVYASLFGIGTVIFGELGLGLGQLALAVVSFTWIARR